MPMAYDVASDCSHHVLCGVFFARYVCRTCGRCATGRQNFKLGLGSVLDLAVAIFSPGCPVSLCPTSLAIFWSQPTKCGLVPLFHDSKTCEVVLKFRKFCILRINCLRVTTIVTMPCLLLLLLLCYYIYKLKNCLPYCSKHTVAYCCV